MNEKDFVTFKTAKKLKEAGYNEPCSYYYTTEDAPVGSAWTNPTILPFEGTSAVSYPMEELHRVQKWLREKKKLHILVDFSVDMAWFCKITAVESPCYICDGIGSYGSYEEALSAGIDAALELITNKTE